MDAVSPICDMPFEIFDRPPHSFPSIGILALGIAAAVSVFSLVDGVLLRPLPYRDADKLCAETAVRFERVTFLHRFRTIQERKPLIRRNGRHVPAELVCGDAHRRSRARQSRGGTLWRAGSPACPSKQLKRKWIPLRVGCEQLRGRHIRTACAWFRCASITPEATESRCGSCWQQWRFCC